MWAPSARAHTLEVLASVFVGIGTVVPAVHLVAAELNARDILDLGYFLALTLQGGGSWVQASVVILNMKRGLFITPLVSGLAAVLRVDARLSYR